MPSASHIHCHLKLRADHDCASSCQTPDGLHPHVSSTLRATLEGTIPAGVTDDADDGGSTSWASSQSSRYGPPELHPRQNQCYAHNQPPSSARFSMVDPLVRSPMDD